MILTLDIECQRAVVERFDLYPGFTHIDRVIRDKRILCFAAKWHGQEKVHFHAAWDDDDVVAHEKMIRAAWELLDAADIVVGWNSTRFDVQHLQSAFGRLKLGPPSPFRSLDLMQVAKKNFKAGELSLKLDWFSRMWLGDRKLSHGGTDLWYEIRYGNRAERRAAQKVMKSYNCLTPDHKVLTTDLRWVEIGSLGVGDRILGFHENVAPENGVQGRRWVPATVLGNRRVVDDVYAVTMSNGDVVKCTADHKWLTSRGPSIGGAAWLKTFEPKLLNNGRPGLMPGRTTVCKYFNPVDECITKDAGWLSGMFDGEGYLYNRKLGGRQAQSQTFMGGFCIGVSQKCGPELDRIYRLLDEYGIHHSAKKYGANDLAKASRGAIKSTLPLDSINITGGFYGALDCLVRIRPERLIDKIDWDNLPRMESRTGWTDCVTVERVDYLGKHEVVILETDTSTYIADGYPMHNCKDVLLTEELFERFKPWTGINYAIYENEDVAVPRCTKCGSENLEKRGYFYTTSFSYQRYRCKEDGCGSWSRGKRSVYSTELRPV